MFITFRSIVFLILSILLLPCSSVEIEVPRTKISITIQSNIISLGTYFDGTMLLQVDNTISDRIFYLIYPNGTFDYLDNINITCGDLDCYELAYPLNPNYILIKSLEGIIIIDWTGNVIEGLGMKSVKVNTSKKMIQGFL